MEKERCILCGEAASAGLTVLGCLICFPCEKRLVGGLASRSALRKLRRIQDSAGLEG